MAPHGAMSKQDGLVLALARAKASVPTRTIHLLVQQIAVGLAELARRPSDFFVHGIPFRTLECGRAVLGVFIIETDCWDRMHRVVVIYPGGGDGYDRLPPPA